MRVIQDIADQLKRSKNILLTCHTDPDGDAICSLLALGIAMEEIGKEITLYTESPIPAIYRFLPEVNRITHTLTDVEKFDTAIVLDCGELERIGKQASKVSSIRTVINLDHHITNGGFGDLQLIDTSCCATAELVYKLIKEIDHPISPPVALCIYTGILTDTGSFRFSNTNRAAFKICEEMMAMGVEPHRVAQNVYGTYSLNRLKLLNHVLDSLEVSEDGKLAIVTVTREMIKKTGTGPEDIDGFINYPRSIEGVSVAVLIQELSPNKYHVSLRSKEMIDVAAIAKQFGGGGHFNASGFSIEGGLAEVKQRLIQAVSGI